MRSASSHVLFSHRLLPLILCALLVTPCSLSYAQSDDDPPQLEAGTWALQFQITDNFTLGAFEGSVLSAKRHLSTSRALRFGVDLSGSTTTQTRDGGTAGERENTRTDLRLGLDVQYLGYLNEDDAVRAYVAAGPTLGYDRLTDKQSTGGSQTSETTADIYELGLAGVVGAEWFVRPTISLTAEYSARALYTTRSGDSEPAGVSEPPSLDRWSVGPQPVRFGVSVYF